MEQAWARSLTSGRRFHEDFPDADGWNDEAFWQGQPDKERHDMETMLGKENSVRLGPRGGRATAAVRGGRRDVKRKVDMDQYRHYADREGGGNGNGGGGAAEEEEQPLRKGKRALEEETRRGFLSDLTREQREGTLGGDLGRK